jgi:hypothetical protein
MNTVKKKTFLAKLSVVLVALLCLPLILTKGWLMFFLLPLSVIILPLYIFIEFIAIKQTDGPHIRWIKAMRHVLTASLLVSYIAFPGVYDIPGGVFLGFFIIESDALTYSLYGLGIAAFLIAGISLFTLSGLLIANHYKKLKHTHQL